MHLLPVRIGIERSLEFLACIGIDTKSFSYTGDYVEKQPVI